MGKVIHCECGATVRGRDEDEIVTLVEQHVRDAHPGLALTREQILSMAQPDDTGEHEGA